MVAFSKFITGQRNSRQLLDTDGYSYVRRKDKDTSTAEAWRCTKNRSLKCVCHVYLNPTDDTLTQGTKTEATYTFLLNIIMRAICVENGIIMLDFELAAINAFRKVFEQFNVLNCFFHLCQSVQKRIFKKFKVQYKIDKAFARASRLVVFLAFVPFDSIEDAFEALSVYIAGTYPELMHVVNYFESNYLGLACLNGTRTSSKFKLEFWNHYNTILVDCDYPRTGNMVEGFHRGFKTRVNRPKPTVQEYFRAIREQQVTTDYHLES